MRGVTIARSFSLWLSIVLIATFVYFVFVLLIPLFLKWFWCWAFLEFTKFRAVFVGELILVRVY